MSDSAVLAAHATSPTGNAADSTYAVPPAPSQRTGRSAGKGRRRRAVAEQRRAEQQHWSNFSHERDDEVYLAPPRAPVSRRQLRRATRRLRGDWEVSFHGEDEDEDNLDIALAISLSLSEPAEGDRAVSLVHQHGNGPLDMSYESLVMLENVKCTAPPAVVSQMTGRVFDKEANSLSTDGVEELCTICQVGYDNQDLYMLLPCSHTFHDMCGSEWFLNHSKLCPVCKHDITEEL